ncbi:MAG: hypothetical protein JWN75_752 [Candidatus Saccharibacteria bacterium]|nr:hypothetical protein [Candidatus Saccharibacteria bacterium]
MTDVVFNARQRFSQKRETQAKVDEYALSEYALQSMMYAHNTPRMIAGQRALVKMRVSHGINWFDLVFYIIVERGVSAVDLIPEIRDEINKLDHEFILCCESRRRENAQ